MFNTSQRIIKAHSQAQNTIKDNLLPIDLTQRRTSMIQLSIKPKNTSTPKRLVSKHSPDEKKKNQKVSQQFSKLVSFKSYQVQQSQQFQSNSQATEFSKASYDVFDLTNSLLCSDLKELPLMLSFIVTIFIRYASLTCLIYISIITKADRWQWIFSIILTYVIYFITIMKVSLRPPIRRSELILRLAFDCLQESDIIQYFQVISNMKMIRTILRASLPPEFSFIFISKTTQTRQKQIYYIVNYIYASIQAIIYYPFFVIYTSIYFVQTMGTIPQIYYIIIMSTIGFAEVIFLALTVYLIHIGYKQQTDKKDF